MNLFADWGQTVVIFLACPPALYVRSLVAGLAHTVVADDPDGSRTVGIKFAARCAIHHPDAECQVAEIGLDVIGAGDAQEGVGAVVVLLEPVAVVEPAARIHDRLACKLILMTLHELALIDVVGLGKHDFGRSIGVRFRGIIRVGQHIEADVVCPLVTIEGDGIGDAFADIVVALSEGDLRTVGTVLWSHEVAFERTIRTRVAACKEIRVGCIGQKGDGAAHRGHKRQIFVMGSRKRKVDHLLGLRQADVLEHEADLCSSIGHSLIERGIESNTIGTVGTRTDGLRRNLLTTVFQVSLQRRESYALSIRTCHRKEDAVAIMCRRSKVAYQQDGLTYGIVVVIVAAGGGQDGCHGQHCCQGCHGGME